MGLIKDKNGNRISVAPVNGYTAEKVLKADEYLKEIGNNRRNFSIDRLVEMYNDIKSTNIKASGCRPCQATKLYNGIQNYSYYGRLTLLNRGINVDELVVVDNIKEEENKASGEVENGSKMGVKEKLEKARAAKKAKQSKNDGEDKD